MNPTTASLATPHAPLPADPRMRTLSLCLLAALGGSAAVASAAPVPQVPRNTITVTNCDSSGPGSFAQAIIDAGSGDLVDLTSLTCSTISLTDGALFITDGSLDIAGPGRDHLTIRDDSPSHTGLLRHTGLGALYIRGVTLAGGRKYTTGADALGACVYSAGVLRLQGVTITDCIASGGSHAALGGAVFSEGGVLVTDSIISGNAAISASHYASGGGIYTNGNLYMNRVTIDANRAESDTWHSFAGGVFTRGRGQIYNSAITHNEAENDGGFALAPVVVVSNHVVANTTISGNTASYVAGGATRGEATLSSDTIAFNVALYTYKNGNPVGAGLHVGTEDNVIINSSIIAQNMAAEVPWDVGAVSSAHSPVMVNCLVRAVGPNVTLPPDNIDADPLIGPLLNNGGPTRTHALLAGSPAFNTGNNADAHAYDQRGYPRVMDGRADIGAYESDSDKIFQSGFE